MIMRMAEEAAALNPELFAGKAPCVWFRLRYAAPYEPFEELRELILRVREATGLRADYRGIVALEVSEWLEHEQEEYFTVMLKFLYDHSRWWNPVMVLSDGSERQLRRFMAACAMYMTPCLLRMPVFAETAGLETMIREAAARMGRTLDREAEQMLARAVMSPRLAGSRNTNLIQRVAQQLSAAVGTGGEISAAQVAGYLRDPDALPVLLAGNTLTDREEQEYERDEFQL